MANYVGLCQATLLLFCEQPGPYICLVVWTLGACMVQVSVFSNTTDIWCFIVDCPLKV